MTDNIAYPKTPEELLEKSVNFVPSTETLEVKAKERSIYEVERNPSEYLADVLQSLENNSIWINAFQLIRPTDEMKQQIGETIIRMLRNKSRTIEQKKQFVKNVRELIVRVTIS